MSETKEPSVHGAVAPDHERDAIVDRIQAAHERLMTLLTATHTPDFLEVGVTMSQAKVLYLVASAGEMHMAELPSRLGVSLSTVSGLVDRLVDHELVDRREDPADRRQAVLRPTPGGRAAMDRFRDLNARQLRELLDRVDPADLAQVERAYAILVEAAAAMSGPAAAPAPVSTATDHRTSTDHGKGTL